MPACAGLLELRGSGLRRLVLKVSYAGCLDLSVATSAQFTLKMCVTARNHERLTKAPKFESSRSFKVICVDKTEKPVTSACYDMQHVCKYLQPFSH